MIDFHTHILPGMDDGAENTKESIMMLVESLRQGVDTVFATPHFYAEAENPESFLSRRAEAYDRLWEGIYRYGAQLPRIYLGAEVLYYPGMSVSDELGELCLENTPCLLVEPPMMPWSEAMLDEIEQTGINLKCIPVIAHIDRYMRLLRDNSLIELVQGRRMVVQVNASFFLRKDTSSLAIRLLKDKKFQLLGSDCHNMDDRAPNLSLAAGAVIKAGALKEFENLNRKSYLMLEI